MDDTVGEPLAAFRSREFSIFFAAGLVSNIGTWMQLVTVPYVVDQLSHSTALVGIAAFCNFIPATIVSPLAGSLSDRQDRRLLLMWSQAVMALTAAALWVLWSTGTATVALVLACVSIGALANGLSMSAWQALVPQLVPRPALLSAVRLNLMQLTCARALGPALAGLVLAMLGAAAAFGLNALSFLVVIGALVVLTPRPPEAVEHRAVMHHFREGVRYTMQRPVFVVPVVLVFFVGMFAVGMTHLLEPFARHVLEVGPGMYGLLIGAFGTGALIGAGIMVACADRFRRSRFAVVGLFGLIVGVVLYGLSTVWAVTFGALLLMGVAQPMVMMSANTALQFNVDERFRGRVLSLFMMSFFGAAPLGALIGGVIGEEIGLRPVLVGAGVILALLTTWSLARWKALQPLDEATPVLDETYLPPPVRGTSAEPADASVVPNDEDARRSA